MRCVVHVAPPSAERANHASNCVAGSAGLHHVLDDLWRALRLGHTISRDIIEESKLARGRGEADTVAPV
jgi:hypothetical protein